MLSKDYVEQLTQRRSKTPSMRATSSASRCKSLWNTVRAYLCMLTLSKVDGEWEGLKMQVPDPVHGTVEGHACDVTPEASTCATTTTAAAAATGGDDDDEDDDVDDDDECMTAEEMDGMCSSHWNDTVLMDDELGAAKDIVDEHVDDLAKLREDGATSTPGWTNWRTTRRFWRRASASTKCTRTRSAADRVARAIRRTATR